MAALPPFNVTMPEPSKFTEEFTALASMFAFEPLAVVLPPACKVTLPPLEERVTDPPPEGVTISATLVPAPEAPPVNRKPEPVRLILPEPVEVPPVNPA